MTDYNRIMAGSVCENHTFVCQFLLWIKPRTTTFHWLTNNNEIDELVTT
jgi:hypothetical protein